MKISYAVNPDLKPKELATLFVNSGIKRPVKNIERVKRMIANANLTICAKDDKKLVGILRSVTDLAIVAMYLIWQSIKNISALELEKSFSGWYKKYLGEKL